MQELDGKPLQPGDTAPFVERSSTPLKEFTITATAVPLPLELVECLTKCSELSRKVSCAYASVEVWYTLCDFNAR